MGPYRPVMNLFVPQELRYCKDIYKMSYLDLFILYTHLFHGNCVEVEALKPTIDSILQRINRK